MPSEQRSYMVLRDDDDNYFAVPREIVDHHRVRREWKTKIRQYLDGEDVEGFARGPGGAPRTTPEAAGGQGLHIVGMFTIDADLFEDATAAGADL